MTAQIADILERAADRIEPEGRWTQGYAALDSNRQPISPTDQRARCWCLAGALAAETGDRMSETYRNARRLMVEVLPFQRAPLTSFNDAPKRTQAEVVAKLREAAAKARERGQ
jgi:hypothetical protein